MPNLDSVRINCQRHSVALGAGISCTAWRWSNFTKRCNPMFTSKDQSNQFLRCRISLLFPCWVGALHRIKTREGQEKHGDGHKIFHLAGSEASIFSIRGWALDPQFSFDCHLLRHGFPHLGHRYASVDETGHSAYHRDRKRS